jgi:aspartyl-tRNA(Asn)/glutamyl-tRNA(Gln) amidotransferase subunit C
MISRRDVAEVAALARLDLTDAEIDHFTEHLAKVLEHAADIEQLDLDEVPPTSHPLPLVNVMRDDVAGATLDRDEVLTVAPDVDEQRFRVPPILGDEP